MTSDPLPDVSRETIATPEEEEGDGDGEEVLSETIVGESIMFEAGEYDESCDSCYHLNPSWKFACMIQGNETCGFLGGNQLNCPYYADRDECRARLEQLPRRKQYGLNPLGLKMPGDE